MRKVSKRFISIFLVLVMLFAMVPTGTIFASAESGSLSMTAEGLTATYSGNGTWSGGGTAAYGTVTGKGSVFTQAQSGSLTFTNTRSQAGYISFDYKITENTGSVTIAGNTVTGSGTYAPTAAVGSGDTVQVVIKSGKGSGKTTSIEITNINLVVKVNATTTFKAPTNGSYTVNGEAITKDTAKTQSSTEAYKLVATPATGYNFIGWYSSTVDGYFDYNSSTTLNVEKDAVVYPVFVSSSTAVFQVGFNLYTDLNKANAAAAAASSKQIVLSHSGVLAAGNYTISSGVNLLIPFDSANTATFGDEPECEMTYVAPTMYSCLTMADGAVINCYGNINVNSTQLASSTRTAGRVCGAYGAIQMTAGSQINMKNGSALYAYGYIGGEGMVWGESGSKVYQFMQIEDWRGGNNSSTLLSSLKNNSFLFSQYYLQNIEAKFRIDSGCTMYGTAAVAAGLGSSKSPSQACAAIVGKDSGMFHITSGYAILKYDATTDRMTLDFYGDLVTDAISMSIKLTVVSSTMNTADYILALPMNYTINVKSGSTVTFAQKFKLLPGTVINIDEGATATVSSGGAVYLYDVNDWLSGTYTYSKNIYQLPYVFAKKGAPVTRSVKENAVLKVDGTLTANGPVYSTKYVDNGGDAVITGKGVYASNVHGSTDLKEVTSASDTTLTTITCVPVRGTIAGHSGYNSFGIGTYRSLNGNCWYQRVVSANGFTVVSGGVQDGTNVYVGNTKDSTVPLILTTEQPCVTLPTNAKVAVSGNQYTLTEINTNVTITAKQHTPVVSVSAKAATCLEAGYTAEEKCSVCGKVISPSTTVAATGHKEEIIPGKSATCTETGLTEGKKCSVCGEIIVAQEVIPAHGHSEKTLPGKAATCTETGLTEGKECSVCGEVLVAQKVIPATGHTYTSVVTAPTCEKDGYTTHTCTVCGYSYVDSYVKATGHKYTITVDGTYKAPTCTEDGKEADLKCANCGKIKTGAVIPATGHTEVIDAAVEATCTKDGLTQGSHCSTCNEVLVAQKVVKALGHDYVSVVTAPTCTTDGYTTHTCSRCGDSYVDSHVDSTGTEHNYTSTKVYEPTCTEEGYTVKICSLCGYELKLEDTVVPAKGHKFTSNVVEPTCTTGGYTTRKCEVCGYTDTVDHVDALGHDFTYTVTEPTCTEKGYTTRICSRCGYTDIPEDSYVSALGHNYVGVITTKATCTENGVMTYTCSHCHDSYTEVIPATGHSFDEGVVTAPTCTEQGYTTYTCKKCEYSYKDNFVDALGHEFGECVIVKDATCLENGLKKRTCIRCDHFETEVISATGHSYTAVVTEPTCTEKGYTTYTCLNCGHSYISNYTDASGHTVVIDAAVAPTCTESGLTEGSHCAVCGTTIIEQETVEALGHTFDSWIVSKPATCTQKGEEERYCSVCGIRETRELAMIAHTVVIDAAIAPTYSSTGLTQGSHCSACNEILEEQKVVDKLVLNWDTFKLALSQLEGYASDYAKNNPGKDPTKLMLNFIRTGIDRYNDDDWTTMAGAEETVFVNDVIAKDKINGTIAYALREIDYLEITMPNGESLVFDHLFGSLNVSSNNNYAQSYTDFGSWAGDICDLMEYSNPRIKATELDAMTEEIRTKYFGVDDVEESGFGFDDVKSDLDAFYIVNQITTSGTPLSEIFENYFNEDLSMRSRAAFFLNNRFAGSLTNDEVRQSIFTTYKNHIFIQLLESGRGLSGLDTLREACCYAFADYLYDLAKDDLVAPEDPDKPSDDPNNPDIYSVFSSKDSTLAPGVTQNISYAIDSNGDQMVYYMSKADIKRSDVNIYANYANNDASSWALSTVSEQMAAAQKKHTNPNDTDNYIENYNAVVGTNANFFNMGTGQPLGLLVMNGKEYSPVNSKDRKYNFFAILKDGTPVIGESSEYDTYKNNIQEAVGGSKILVKDGVNQFTEATTDKMPRSCVGITADGQIIMLVLDGRQSPYSVGATFYEIAQIMLDAGCVDALELDGGGSATYDAKQEGSDDITVVNRPCDSVERSVSSSLMVVSTAETSKEFDHAIVNTDTDYLTIGSTFDVSLTGVGAAGNMTDIPADAMLKLSDDTIGSLDGNKFTATAKGKVDIQVVVDGKVVGSKTIEVVTRPTALKFSKDNINAIYGVAEELPLVATYNNNPVTINTNDITFEMTNELAGEMDGFSFIGNDEYMVRNVTITAKVKTDVNISADITLRLYNTDESIFDFENATAGNESLAWNRDVSNTFTSDNKIYYKVDTTKDATASYIFAIDMKAITAPTRLQPLMEYLAGFAGNVGDNASPWDYLLALGGRVSDLTNVTVTMKFPEKVDVDFDNLAFVNDFFKISNYSFDEATHTLTIVCRWTRQTDGIDPSTANSIAILSGVKVTPKKDTEGVVNIDVTGNVTYDIYLDTSQLYKFAKDPANQEKYGIYDYINPDDPEDAGGHFSDTYVTFEDHFSIDEQPLNGWVKPDGEQYYYYVNNQKVTGIYYAPDQDGLDKSYYYTFDDNGACTGKLTGLFYDETAKSYRYARYGELQKGWIMIENDWYYFNSSYNAQTGSMPNGGVTYEFEETGRLKSGVWAKTVFGTKYYYGPGCYNKGWVTIDGNRYYFENSYRYEGYHMIFNANVRYWYNFGDDGICKDEIVPTGFYEDEKGISYVIDGIGVYGLYKIDGSYYCFDYYGYARKGFVNAGTSHCDLNPGNYYFGDDYKAFNGIAKNQNGDLVYYKNGRPSMAGLVEVDGDYYFAGGANGEIFTNKKQYTWANTTSLPNGTYEFGADGKMLNGIVDKDGTLYYYYLGKPKMAGLVEINGDYYFAGGANGEISVNKVQYVWQTNGISLPNPNCEFGADGKMLDGIVNKNGTLYYYVMGRPKMAGLVEVDGAYYFAGGANGEITVNKVQYVWETNGISLANPNCEFGSDGKMLDGIVNKNGTLYYYEMGRPKMAGLIEIDGDYYFAGGANGEITVNKVQNVWKTNGISLSNPNCEFDADGKMLNGIIERNGSLYYYEMGIPKMAGLVEVDGDYYFAGGQNGEILTNVKQYTWANSTSLPNGTYEFGADGKMLNGIVERDGTLYYYEMGQAKVAGLICIDGDYYFVGGSNGEITVNKKQYVWKSNGLLPEDSYEFGADGKMLNGFITRDDGIYYYDTGKCGKLGLNLIDGDYYFVGYYGKLYTNGTYYVWETNGYSICMNYTFDESGKLVK